MKPMQRIVEIRTYRLKPGSGAAFHALVSQQSVPLHAAAEMDVVAHGISLHEADAYYLIRSYESLEQLKTSQRDFYASTAWRQGPREAIIGLIESDANVVLPLSSEAIDALRGRPGSRSIEPGG